MLHNVRAKKRITYTGRPDSLQIFYLILFYFYFFFLSPVRVLAKTYFFFLLREGVMGLEVLLSTLVSLQSGLLKAVG